MFDKNNIIKEPFKMFRVLTMNFSYLGVILLLIVGLCAIYLSLQPVVKEDKTTALKQEVVIEKTLSIIKPDAVSANHIGDIYKSFADAKLDIVAAKMIKLSKVEAGEFYIEHKGKPFYNDLINFMSSGPIMVQILSGPNAIQAYRDLMGSTKDYMDSKKSTLRARYASTVMKNAVHGSDSQQSAAREIDFFLAKGIC